MTHTPDCHIASEEHQRPHRCRDSGCACTCAPASERQVERNVKALAENAKELAGEYRKWHKENCPDCSTPVSEEEKDELVHSPMCRSNQCCGCGDTPCCLMKTAKEFGITPPIPEAWTDRFEKMRAGRSEFCLQDCHNDAEELKDFLRQELSLAHARGVAEGRKAGIEEAEKALMKHFDKLEFAQQKFHENDDWRNYKFVRNNIRDVIEWLSH